MDGCAFVEVEIGVIIFEGGELLEFLCDRSFHSNVYKKERNKNQWESISTLLIRLSWYILFLKKIRKLGRTLYRNLNTI